MGYDNAITIFSPDGRLFQVEYAQEAVKKGNTVVAVTAKNLIVMAVESKSEGDLQIERIAHKLCLIDKHIIFGFAGLTADARIIIQQARISSQEYSLTYDDSPSVEVVAKKIALFKQNYTQSNGKRPFGISGLLAGFDPATKKPRLFQTDPSGTYLEWKASCIGKKHTEVVQFLETKYPETDLEDYESVLKMTIEALCVAVQADPSFMEVAVFRVDSENIEFIKSEKIGEYIKQIKEASKKK